MIQEEAKFDLSEESLYICRAVLTAESEAIDDAKWLTCTVHSAPEKLSV